MNVSLPAGVVTGKLNEDTRFAATIPALPMWGSNGDVAVGEQVAPGQRLGRCGNSGNSDFPHIHMHVQDAPVVNAGHGQNMVFAGIDVELTGKQFTDVTWPLIRGLFVENH